MAENINAYCSICGKGYHICNSCAEQKTFRPWRSITDTIEHYKIYMAIHGYTVSKNKEDAKAELSTCDLGDMDSFTPDIKKVISKIMAEDKKEEKIEEDVKSSKIVPKKVSVKNGIKKDIE